MSNDEVPTDLDRSVSRWVSNMIELATLHRESAIGVVRNLERHLTTHEPSFEAPGDLDCVSKRVLIERGALARARLQQNASYQRYLAARSVETASMALRRAGKRLRRAQISAAPVYDSLVILETLLRQLDSDAAEPPGEIDEVK